jgi:hypothetical protein
MMFNFCSVNGSVAILCESNLVICSERSVRFSPLLMGCRAKEVWTKEQHCTSQHERKSLHWRLCVTFPSSALQVPIIYSMLTFLCVASSAQGACDTCTVTVDVMSLPHLTVQCHAVCVPHVFNILFHCICFAYLYIILYETVRRADVWAL